MSNIASIPEPFIPRIVITAGEPAGIAPEIIAQISQHEFLAEVVVIADPQLLKDRAALMGLSLQLKQYASAYPRQQHKPGTLSVIPIRANKVIPGQLDTANTAYVLDSIRQATQGCLEKQFEAMVTTPVNKAIINDSSVPFSGHTEYIAELCGGTLPVMMLMNKHLRIALVTTHLPLAGVAAAVTPEVLTQVINIINSDMRTKMGIETPRLLVCGLNPHAGESGHLGKEEIEVIIPVIKRLHSEGMCLDGPVPADTAFTTESLKNIDAVICMYHDQGLPVLKSQGFGEIVNLTLGLPIIRTSVDHGTALELAGTDKARPDSLIAAIHSACELACNKHNPIDT